jgi:hypothetical protein
LEVIEPEMSEEERQSLDRSGETLKQAVASVELRAFEQCCLMTRLEP